MNDITLADALLMQFCKRVQRFYGESAVTPNMHMHAHLKEDLPNYGPVYEFWLFSFERYNGILGNQPTNNRLPERQLMQRFINDNSTYSFQFPEEFKDDLNPLYMTETRLAGSVSDTLLLEFSTEGFSSLHSNVRVGRRLILSSPDHTG